MTTTGARGTSVESPGETAAGVGRRGIGAWVRAAMTAFGLGRAPERPAAPPATDRGTRLAEERTRLATERSFLAAERTLMAWVRTSLSMISFGFTMVKFFEYLQQDRQLSVQGLFGHSFAPASLGLTLITIGTLALVAAVLEHRRVMQRLHAHGLVPRWSLALTVASVVAVLGLFAFGSLVLHY